MRQIVKNIISGLLLLNVLFLPSKKVSAELSKYVNSNKDSKIEQVTENTPLILQHSQSILASNPDTLLAAHGSHSSHASHASHASHTAHASHYSSTDTYTPSVPESSPKVEPESAPQLEQPKPLVTEPTLKPKTLKEKTYKSTKSPVKVKGYLKKSGKYVNPYTRTKPNKTKIDNYSTKGNINPYTGKKGTEKIDTK